MSDDQVLGARYWIEAGGFRHCMEVLLAEMDTQSNGMPANRAALPIYYLASHAAELLLKAALLKRGTTNAEIRKYDLRHDLAALTDKLKTYGVVITDQTTGTIGKLSGQHREHHLRYPSEGSVMLPHPQALRDMLNELILCVRVGQRSGA